MKKFFEEYIGIIVLFSMLFLISFGVYMMVAVAAFYKVLLFIGTSFAIMLPFYGTAKIIAHE